MFAVFTKETCSYCTKAKELLKQNHLPFYEVTLNDPEKVAKFKELYPNLTTVPQIFIPSENKHIGGYNDLVKYLNEAD